MALEMKELDEHNKLLNDRAAMDEVYAEQGYLFFRGVLDPAAVEAVRAKYFSILVDDYEVVDEGQSVPLWNGKDVSGFPLRLPEIHDSGVWRTFVANPKVHALFEHVVGEPISWIPSTEYRLTPPAAEVPADFLARSHQDGFYNAGVPFRTCWLPLSDIDEEVGGIALAPGLHKRGYLHDLDSPPWYGIPAGEIPDTAWARATTYRPGDVLMFSEQTPHVGLPNRSVQFRLSMDIRVTTKSAAQPVVGVLTAVAPGSITIDTGAEEVTLTINARSYLRLREPAQLPLSQIERFLKIGQKMMAGRDGDQALVVRPQKG